MFNTKKKKKIKVINNSYVSTRGTNIIVFSWGSNFNTLNHFSTIGTKYACRVQTCSVALKNAVQCAYCS